MPRELLTLTALRTITGMSRRELEAIARSGAPVADSEGVDPRRFLQWLVESKRAQAA